MVIRNLSQKLNHAIYPKGVCIPLIEHVRIHVLCTNKFWLLDLATKLIKAVSMKQLLNFVTESGLVKMQFVHPLKTQYNTIITEPMHMYSKIQKFNMW